MMVPTPACRSSASLIGAYSPYAHRCARGLDCFTRSTILRKRRVAVCIGRKKQIRSACSTAAGGKGARETSATVTAWPSRRSHAAGDASPKGCRPSSYVDTRTTCTAFIIRCRLLRNLKICLPCADGNDWAGHFNPHVVPDPSKTQPFGPKAKDVAAAEIGLESGNDRTVFAARRTESGPSRLSRQPVKPRRKP